MRALNPIFKIGMIVENPVKPEWGPGKVVHVEGGNIVHVLWRNLKGLSAKKMRLDVIALELAAKQQDDILDNLPPTSEDNGKYILPHARLLFEDAVKVFLDRFPEGFYDTKYIGDSKMGERQYKVDAHRFAVEHLGDGKFRHLLETDDLALVKQIKRCISKVNLLFPVEHAALKDALEDREATRRWCATLAQLLESPGVNEGEFIDYAKATAKLPADRGRVATWPVTTILPFLLQPDRHMFFKPKLTTQAAEVLGFNLNYDPNPNWLTYRRLLKMAEIYRKKLAALKPRDLIDVQSFLFITCSPAASAAYG